MRILMIAPQPFYEDRGTPIAVRDALRVLSKLGFEVDVATFPMGEDVNIRGMRLLRTVNPLGFRSVPVGLSFRKLVLDMCLFVTVLRLAFRHQYGCAHGVEEGAAMALICKSLFGVPVIYDMHSSLPDQIRKVRGLSGRPVQWLVKRFERWLVKYADCIVASRGLAPRVLSIAPGKTVWECSFNGLGSRRRNDELAGHLGVINRPTVVYTGTFAPYQGLDLLIEAATMVHAKIPEVVFLLVGGTEFDLPHLTRLAAQRGLTDALQLHPRRPRREVADYLSLAHVLVLPRVAGENAPLKIYEYMKSGKPIVATDIPAHRAVLSEEMAILVRPEATGLAEGILQALQNTVHTKKLVEAAQNAGKALAGKPLQTTLAEAYNFLTGKGLGTTRRHA